MESDRQLVEAAREGDRPSFAKLVERYERTVRAVALNVLEDRHEASDAAQEAFVIAYRKLRTLRRPSAFGAWLGRIARRQALRLARSRRRAAPLGAAEDVACAGDNGRLREEHEQLLAAVERLPRHERAVVMLRHFDGRSVGQIAEMTGRPVGTVTKQLSRAHERLRRQLTQEQ